MAIDKDTLLTFSNYVSKTAILILPGLVIVEMVFHKGLLSGNVHSVTELILLILWSFLFSVPYYASASLTQTWFSTPFKEVEKRAKGFPLKTDYYEDALWFTAQLLLITVITYKLLLSLNWLPSTVYFGMRREYLTCIASITLTMLVSIPLAGGYYWLYDRLILAMVRYKLRRKH